MRYDRKCSRASLMASIKIAVLTILTLIFGSANATRPAMASLPTRSRKSAGRASFQSTSRAPR